MLVRKFFLLCCFNFFLLSVNPVAYADSSNCVSCHQQAVSDWSESDHAKAMDIATSKTVLANFNNVTTSHFTQTARFYKEDKLFKIDLTEQDKTTTYQIEYTFGHYPLQQYLTKTVEGKLQVFPFAWDSRIKKEGGQRWYPNFATEDIQKNDRLHWQQPLQNWNGMCADCHSDGLKRNYSIPEDTFETNWDNINVGCQSCHGKMEEHGNSSEVTGHNTTNVLIADQSEQQAVMGWLLDSGEPVAKWQGEARDNQFMDGCFSCHSLRSPLTDGIDPSKSFLDQFSPNLLTSNLYYADGQIKEEVYVYGSFLQSKMYQAGVNCLDCHNKHTMKVKIPNNGLCLQCHNAENYQTEKHTHHPLDSDGGQCVNCHMPETRYMGVDDRRDHSFRIPRPDLSIKYGTPNGCTNCHQDKQDKWAEGVLLKWHGTPKNLNNAEQLFIELQHNYALPEAAHFTLINDDKLAVIKRASAISLLPNSVAQVTEQQIHHLIISSEPLIRLATAQIGFLLSKMDQLKSYKQLLQDPLKAVRVAAANQLLNVGLENDKIFNKALSELFTFNEVNSWRGEGNLNRSLTYSHQGKIQQAINALKHAIKVDPFFDVSYVNLGDVYRNTGNAELEKQTYELGLKNNPTSGTLHYSQGMFLIRSGDKGSSVASFAKAMSLDKANPQFAYLYFLALDSIGNTVDAVTQLKAVINQYGKNQQLGQLGLGFSQKNNDRESYQFFYHYLTNTN